MSIRPTCKAKRQSLSCNKPNFSEPNGRPESAYNLIVPRRPCDRPTVEAVATSLPRPGFIIGISLFSLGDFAAIIYVVILTLQRFGSPPDYKTWLATVAILAESFGCVLIAMHLFFHDRKLMQSIGKWFHGDDQDPTG